MKAAAHAPMPIEDRQEALRGLLANLAGETGDLARAADQLQLLFGQLMSDRHGPPQDALERAQALDALVQRLQGLERFLIGLSGAALDDVQGDAARAAASLRLASQASRFSPRADAGHAGQTSGDCDLF